MSERPFSPEIKSFEKPLEVGDTNQIYYDPKNPDILIRIPVDEESRFLESDPKLIRVAEKSYKRLQQMSNDLDIDIAPHQFIVAQETKNGPIKPMLLAKRIEGNHLIPIDKDNKKQLDAINRIALLGQRYIQWIERDRPKAVVTDVFRPEQYIVRQEEGRDMLYLIDIEPRLKQREHALHFIRWELMMLVGPLRNTEYEETFRLMISDVLRYSKHNRSDRTFLGLVGLIVAYPEGYSIMSEDFLNAKKELRDIPDEMKERMKNTNIVIDQKLLDSLGIDKI